MSKKSNKGLSREMRELKEVAMPGLPTWGWHDHRPPEPRDIVQALANVSQNRLARIRELEKQIYLLCELGKKV
jgi:hypothetical protein